LSNVSRAIIDPGSSGLLPTFVALYTVVVIRPISMESHMPAAKKASSIRRKLIEFDEETWHAVDLLARDSMKTWQELADEAFRDLLDKHGRPTDLRTALKQSAKRPVAEK